MEFPCEFPVKIIGKNNPGFANNVMNIVRKHYPGTLDNAMTHQASQKNNYLAVTVTVHALNQSVLDALYLELTQYPDIKMVL